MHGGFGSAGIQGVTIDKGAGKEAKELQCSAMIRSWNSGGSLHLENVCLWNS